MTSTRPEKRLQKQQEEQSTHRSTNQYTLSFYPRQLALVRYSFHSLRNRRKRSSPEKRQCRDPCGSVAHKQNTLHCNAKPTEHLKSAPKGVLYITTSTISGHREIKATRHRIERKKHKHARIISQIACVTVEPRLLSILLASFHKSTSVLSQ